MPAVLDNVSVLRQRVLDSLTKRSSTPVKSAGQDDDEIEEGEIQESVDTFIGSRSKVFQADAVNQPRATDMLYDFAKGIPGLNSYKSNAVDAGPLSSSKVTKSKVLSMPHDLPVEYPTKVANNAVRATKPEALFRANPPWLNSSGRSSPSVNGKRHVSTEFPGSDRPFKRLGTERHPSLVIDLASDDDEIVRDRVRGSSTIGAGSGAIAASENDSVAKLRKVEADIAQAMAIINKAQDLQNARKISASQKDSPLPEVQNAEPVVTSSSRSDTSQKKFPDTYRERPADIRASQITDLESLRVELARSDQEVASKRKDLLGLRLENAELQNRKTLANIRQQNSRETMETVQEEIVRLQADYAAGKAIFAEMQELIETLDAETHKFNLAQDTLTNELRQRDAERKMIRSRISTLQESLSRYNLVASQDLSPRPSTGTVAQHDRVLKSNTLNGSHAITQSLDATMEDHQNSPINGLGTEESLEFLVQKDSSVALPATPNRAKNQVRPREEPVVEMPERPVLGAPREVEEAITKSLDARQQGAKSVPSVKKREQQPLLSRVPEQPVDMLQAPPEVFHEHPAVNPYTSILARFKNFKYHSQYVTTVRSGFRSSTYFHKLSPDRVMCRFEVQGGICNAGKGCGGQHFADAIMTGFHPRNDQILIELSAATLGKTPKEKAAFRDGLRAVLQKMKAENIDDFHQVCQSMVDYRRSRQDHINQSISSFF